MKRDDKKTIQIMEVCGTHTQAIAKSGIRHLLPSYVKLLSGPGCPVCVTNETYIDTAISLLMQEGVILATFGDMLKVQGTASCLSEKKNKHNVIPVYSPEDAVTLAQKNPENTIIFLAVGFETTAPIIAATIKNVYEHGPKNLFFFTALKRMEPILQFILNDKQNKIDGLLCPGHVASILGADAFRFITNTFQIHAVVCGFQPEDVKAGIFHLLEQIEGGNSPSFVNLYSPYVRSTGNLLAQQYMQEIFQVEDGIWRGIGKVSNSALGLQEKYQVLDAKKKFPVFQEEMADPFSCQCREIILGIKAPYECMQFGTSCTPEHPKGPCMISSEGACAAHYRYGGISFDKYN